MYKINFFSVLFFFTHIIIYGQGAGSIGTYENPALSATQIIVMNPSAIDTIYWLDPDGDGGNDPFQAYCDMTTDGGGWTLVLLNNASVSGCPTPTWDEVVNNINYNGVLSADITSFDLFLGVKYWNALGTEMRLEMGASPTSLSHQATYNYSLNESGNYAPSMSDETVSIHTEGTASPGMYTYHNGRELSTCDADHDPSSSSCAASYNCAAWWYGSCWNGSFWGGGGAMYQDAPYWAGSSTEYFAYGAIWVRGAWTPVLPDITTQAVTDISWTTATGNGNISDLGTPNPTAYGVCWNTTGTPEITDNITDEGNTSSTGAFTSSMTGLMPDITYYVRAYATNFAGTGYGDEVSFTTPEDITPPSVICNDTTVFLDADGTFTVDTSFIHAGTHDNCSIDTIYLMNGTFYCDDVGDNVIRLYAIDGSGNIDSCSAVITVADTISPDLITQNATVYLDASGNASLEAGSVITRTEDNCGIADSSVYPSVFTCENLGTKEVNVTVEDGSGNSTTKTAQINVIDTISPVVNCINDQVREAGTSNSYTVSGDEFDPISAEDNCNYALINNFNNSDILAGSILPSGTTQIKWVITDASGNADSCSFTVEVDNTTAFATDTKKELSVYPNPTNGKVVLELPEPEKVYTLEITDITGTVLYSKETNGEKSIMDLNGYPPGIYYLRITGNDYETVTKVIKQY